MTSARRSPSATPNARSTGRWAGAARASTERSTAVAYDPAIGHDVRPDLLAAHEEAWASLARPGTWWDGHQRRELASTALTALTEGEPLPPWMPPSSVEGRLPRHPVAPPVAHDVVYRVAAHASTTTDGWHRQVADQLGPDGDVAYVELVALTCTVAAVVAFRRGAGLGAWPLPDAADGAPSRVRPDALVVPQLNWVPVAPPADERAAVVQAFTSVPAEHDRLWRLAAAQYIPDLEMVDPRWTRGTLTRPQMELVAARVSRLRECFY